MKIKNITINIMENLPKELEDIINEYKDQFELFEKIENERLYDLKMDKVRTVIQTVIQVSFPLWLPFAMVYSWIGFFRN